MIRRAALVACLALAAPAFAGAADPAAEVAAASAGVAAAGVALEAARAGGGDRVVPLGAAIEGYEAALAGLRSGIGAAAARERALSLGMATRRDEVARLLAALQAVSRTPPPATGLHPEGPIAAARAAAMVERLTPALRAEADALAAALAEVGEIRGLQGQATGELEAGLATLAAAQGELAAAMAAAAPMLEAGVGPALTMMARDSESLTQLAAALAGASDAPPAPAAAPEPIDRPMDRPMDWPVQGELMRGFQEPDAAGVRRPGVVLRAPPLSLVRAPADATVRYAGPFLEYGYVVVLEPGPETMVVLAGLAQLQARTGDVVRRGEPLGLLGGRPLGVEEYVMLPLSDTGAGGGETLYIEVRQGRGPVDPAPLFARKG
jgi:septal ring factor EnvC (AmiA/AmiB activator)